MTPEPKASSQRTIIALGGGGFLMEPHNPLLDQYIFDQCQKERPRICFIPTACGDADSAIRRFYFNMKKYDIRPSHLSLFKPLTDNFYGFLRKQDIIYVGGGNTRNLLVLWREWGLDHDLKRLYQEGKIFCGISAGAICWFEQGLTDSIPGELSALNCLGYLPGSCSPHFDGEAERRPRFRELVDQGELNAGIGIDDGCAVHFENEKIKAVVSSRPNAQAYRFSPKGSPPIEETLPARYLGGPGKTLIRRALDQDVADLHSAHMESIQKICAPDYTPEQIEAWGNRPLEIERRTAWILENPTWVLEINGKIEGYGQTGLVKDDPRQSYLYGLYLTPRALGQGHGKALLQLLEDWARLQKCAEMELVGTKTALDFYLSQGYEIVDRNVGAELRGVMIPGIKMRKDL